MGTRTSRINALRGFCRSLAFPVTTESQRQMRSRVLADPNTSVPQLIRGTMKLLIEEIHFARSENHSIRKERPNSLSKAACTTFAVDSMYRHFDPPTAMVAATSGSVAHFKDASFR